MRRRERTVTSVQATHGELRQVLADLVEVAVWTSPDGRWQEHASFLLGTGDGRWHAVGFADPAAGPLVAHLLTLPGFDRDLLFELLGPRVARVCELWRRPPATPDSPPATPTAEPLTAEPPTAEPVIEAPVIEAPVAPAVAAPVVPAQRSAADAPVRPATSR